MEDYTLANLVKEVKSRLGDEEFSDEIIIRFLNFAQDEILGEDKYPFLEKIDEFETYLDSDELDLPRDYQSTIHLFAGLDESKIRLKYLPFEEFSKYSFPFSYTRYGDKLLYNIKSEEQKPCYCDNGDSKNPSYTIKHFYLAKPLKMTEDDDSPVIPEEYSEALILSALARAERRRDNFDYAQVYETQAEAIIVNMKTRYGMRQMNFENKARLPFGMR